MSENSSSPINLKCKVCGGEIRNDYLSGTCKCAHCGNKFSMDNVIPEYEKYSNAIEMIKKATNLLSGKPDVTNIAQAKLLFQQASAMCFHTDPISTDLLKISKAGIKDAEDLRHYAMACNYFDKKSYRQALTEFEKIPGFRDTDEKIRECQEFAQKEKKKHIPFAIIIGLIIPTLLGVLMKEKLGMPLYIIIPVCIVLAAGCSYALYLEGILATIIIVLSLLSAVPLIIFMILAYGFHMEPGPAAGIAIGVPVAFAIAVAANSKPGNTN